MPGNMVSNPMVIASLGPTNHTVTVTDDLSGCITTDVSTVVGRVAVADAGPDWLLCSGGLVELGSSAIYPSQTYSWRPVLATYENGTDSTSRQPQFIALTNVTFFLTATDTVSGCIAMDTVSVTVTANPSLIDFPDTSICLGNPILIGAPALPGVSYVWSPAAGLSCTSCPQPVANPTSTTLYTVIATFPGGCNAVGDRFGECHGE